VLMVYLAFAMTLYLLPPRTQGQGTSGTHDVIGANTQFVKK
jgi:hypothetical protein